jgi:hypothetical protein
VKIKILNYDTVVFLLVGFGNRGGIVWWLVAPKGCNLSVGCDFDQSCGFYL